jgi:septin family protein
LTPEELVSFKKRIMNQILQAKINIYEFPQESEENAKLPFAVVGSNCVLEVNEEKIRGRRYPWGIVNVSKDDCSGKGVDLAEI